MVEDHRRTVISLLSFVVMITVLTSESIVQKTFKQDENKRVKKVEIERYEWEYHDGIDKHKVSNIKMQCANIRNEDKFDCYPEGEITQAACVNRRCCWKPVMTDQINKSVDLLPPLNVPWCYYPKDYSGFKTNKVYSTDIGFNADLSRTTQSHYPETIMDLTLEVRYETQTRLRIKIYDPKSARYEVPITTPIVSKAANDPLYKVNLSKSTQQFSFVVVRKDNSVALINTTGASPLTFCNQFIELSTFLPSNYIYGLGEHRGPLLHSMNWTRFTMWNKDQPPRENTNLYGAHPFYLMMENDGKSHGVFLLNSNAMDVILQPSPAITWRTIGGIIDMYVFMGPTPGEVIQQYTDVIGHTFMPPYWSLGFHLCRWGFKNTNETLEIVKKLRKAEIPQDVQWNDIDYMDRKEDFTYSSQFGDMPSMVDVLHQEGLHYVMIVDPGISNQSPGKYYPYDLGIDMDIFIKDDQGKPLVGKVWPGDVTFPDFTNNETYNYWSELVKKFHDEVNFDGIWIDMNEVSNFVAGSVNSCPKNSIEDPPYLPAVAGGSLKFSTVCATSQQNASISYNVHNLYGLTEAAVTYMALKNVRKKRPFSISRSTYASHGQFGGHWSGDNFATYHDMAMSIPEILNFNMFGISMVGADICGFALDTTEDLCQRWYELGAFYPFSRSHNTLGARAQDPTAFSQKLTDSTKTAYRIRYSLLPYLYTLFHKSHMMGQTVARPLFFEFPMDKQTYSIDTQFLWGSSLLISPVLTKGATSVNAYLPVGVWYDWYSGQPVQSSGSTFKLDAPSYMINIHTRGGSILPLQDPAYTTTESRKNSFSLVVSLDINKTAEGDIFWDDGDTIDTHLIGKFNMIKFSSSKNTVTSNVMYAGYKEEQMKLETIVIFGLDMKPSSVKMNGILVVFTFDSNKVLRAEQLSTDILKPFTFEWM